MSKTPKEMAEEYAAGLVFDDGMYNTAKKAFLAGNKAAQPQWISATNKLPENNQQVFYRIRLSTKNGSRWLFDYGEWDADRQVFYGEFVDYRDLNGTVTHWMPLPPKPEEEPILTK